MSQAQQQQQQQQEPDAGGEKPQTQPSNVRVVPIFVEGRDEPVINKDHGDTSGGQVPPTQHHHHQQQPHANHYHEHMNPRTGRDRASDIDFAFNNGTDIPSFAQGASISDWAKSMPVRSNMKDRFRDFFGDERDSPIRNISVNHMHGEPRVHNIRRQASPQPQQERKRTSSGSSAPTPPPQQQQQQQQQQAPPQKPEAKTKLPTAPPTNTNNNNKKEPTPPPSQQPQAPPTQVPPKPVPVDAITKIQQIQKDVLDLMGKVEKFEGKTKKDKEYLYLDEMLTQNLLKLDTVDTDGKENVKLARKEAVKCINRCLNVLEAKAEASEVATKAGSPQPSSSPQPESQKQAAAAGNEEQTEPSKTPSQSSVYDNNQQEAAVVSESPAGETSTTSQ